MKEIKRLFDEPPEIIGASIILLAAVGGLVDAFAYDIPGVAEDNFWTFAGLGASIYGAKAVVLLKQLRDKRNG